MDEIHLLDLASGIAHFNAPARHIANQHGNNDTRGLDQCAYCRVRPAGSHSPRLRTAFLLEVIMRWSVVVVAVAD
jgi:hypothetical protein